MFFRSSLAFLLFCVGTLAASSAFVDPKTNISFSQWSSSSGFTFGIALPQTPGSDFIGRMSGPSRAKYGGVTLGPSMTGRLMLVAWPNGGSIVHSTRLARTKTNPPEFTGGAKMIPIREGTFVDGSKWTFTFLCKGCITGSSLSFGASSASARMGWAISSLSVGNAASSNGKLGMHRDGTGTFNLDLSSAKNAKYGTWAEMGRG